MAVLKAEHLSFRFPDGTHVISDLDLAVRPGEMLAILGANASGKSTLLRLLAGLLHPTSGRVTIDDTSITRARDRVGLVFQNPDHQMIAPTVEEEIALGLELRGVSVPEIKPRLAVILRQFDLESMRHLSPQALSGGQKQRVALAATMIVQPAYMLFDEPDSLLDAPSRADLMGAMTLVRQSCGIVWTSPHPKRMPEADYLFELVGGALHAL